MSLGVCLNDLHAQGKIGDERYEKLRPVYEELVDQYAARGMDDAAARSEATRRILDQADFELAERKRRTLLQAEKQAAWTGDAKRNADERGIFSMRWAKQWFVDMDNHRIAIAKQAHGMMAGMYEKHRRNIAGIVRNRSDLSDVLRELDGVDTGSVNAREIAETWTKTAEWLRSRFNAAGGHIAKMELWKLPQRHDMMLMVDAGEDAWKAFIRPLLDRKAMIDYDTGLPMSDAKLELVLSDAFKTIASDGWTKNQPGGVHPGAVGNSRAGHRVLHFLDAESWLKYAEEFGGYKQAPEAAIFDAMSTHVEGMARDIAAMERMGPNPAASLRFMEQSIQKNASESIRSAQSNREASRLRDLASSAEGEFKALFDEFTGRVNRPERRRVAMGFSIFRAQQTAAKLGSAVLSVGGDYGTMFTTARFNGLQGRKVMGRYISMLNPANAEDRQMAARTGLIADTWTGASSGAQRLLGEEILHEGARRMAQGVLRGTGMMYHTDIARQAFSLEMVGFLTQMRSRSFDQLEEPFANLLKRYNIDERRWELMRSTKGDQWKETEWLWPEKLAERDQGLADDYMRMLQAEANFAVPVPDLRARAIVSGTIGRHGTFLGEVIKSAFLFKGFPISIMAMHGNRMIDAGMSRGQVARSMATMLGARYAVPLLAYTTLGGALSLQVKEIARGRDPRPMDDPKFWAAAGLQGGGLGIFGDLLFADRTRIGGGIAQTLVGPGGQLYDNVVGRTVQNIGAMTDGDETTESKWGQQAAKIIMSETPGISAWYTRLAVERTLGDLLTEMTYDDPAARNRRLRGYAEEYGTDFWAPPGASADEYRTPDLSNALGNDEELVP